jgi:hypothetical protein
LFSKNQRFQKNKNLKKELIESYKSMSAADLELLKEWDFASTEVD